MILVLYFGERVLHSMNCPTQRAPDPRNSTGASVVGVGAFSGSLSGLELVPIK
jgi:hypothetical protein